VLASQQRSPVSRGDLLRVLAAAKTLADCQALAPLLGFERAHTTLIIDVMSPAAQSRLVLSTDAPSAPGVPLRAPMLGAALLPQPPAQAAPGAGAAADGPLLALTDADWGAAPGAAHAAPAMPPIVPRGRLLPALDRALRVQRTGGIDIAKWVDALSRRSPPTRQARLKVQRLAPQRVLVLDMDVDGAMAAYRHDIAWLVHSMQRSLGGVGFQVRWLVQGHTPLAGWLDVTPGKTQAAGDADPPNPVHSWQPLTPDTQVLLVSDMGLSAVASQAMPAPWAQWLKRVQSHGARVQVWSPVPLCVDQPTAAQAALPVVHWSAAGTLRPQPLARGRAHHTPQRLQLAQALLARLAFCGSIDAYLARTMRLALGPAGLDAGLEQLAWQSSCLTRGAATRRMRPDRLGHHRNAFASLPPPAQLQVQALATAYYSTFSVPLAHMHTLGWVSRVQAVPAQVLTQLKSARLFAESLAAAPSTSGAPPAEVAHFLHTWLQHADAREQAHHSHLRSGLSVALLGMQNQPATAVQIPADLPHAALAQRLAPGAVATQHWLVQDARTGQVLLTPTPPVAGQSPLLADALPLATADLQTAPGAARHWLALGGSASTPLVQRASSQPLVLRSSELAVCIAPIQRPRGVVGWHRNQQGLHLQGAALGGLALQAEPASIRLLPPPAASLNQGLTVEVTTQPQAGTNISFGIHAQHGLYLDLQVAGVVQRFIWIEPTGPQGFVMGSSASERQRITGGDTKRWTRDEGPQHTVHLTEGFWLADTSCTQALWMAVRKGKNPSRSADKPGWRDLPIEQVSHEDVDVFLAALQSQLPQGSQAALPTEAQWEYACRAGTQTAYWWGDDFDKARANVNEDYNGTTPVKRFEPNPWGLHDMHGNVWEWCADGKRDYASDAEVDPAGERDVALRVVRGGSWFYHAAFARAAYRHSWSRGYRDDSLGFRLALRSIGPGGAGVGLKFEPGVGQAGGQPPARPEGAAPGFLKRAAGALRGLNKEK
jgi:formylglycine-generating enzyme required for sulfatase activity